MVTSCIIFTLKELFDSKFIKNITEGCIWRKGEKNAFGLMDRLKRSFFFHMLHRFFTSAKNEEERLTRLKDFLEGLFQFNPINNNHYKREPYIQLAEVVDELFELLKHATEVRIYFYSIKYINHAYFIFLGIRTHGGHIQLYR